MAEMVYKLSWIVVGWGQAVQILQSLMGDLFKCKLLKNNNNNMQRRLVLLMESYCQATFFKKQINMVVMDI